MSKDDLFGDEGAIKHQLKEGAGWKTPADGDEVKCSIKATAADGKVVFEKGEVEYTLGSGAFGALAKVADRALRGMKKQEEIMIKVTKDYLLGDETPDGGKVELTLHGLFETKDVSFLKDKSVMKKQIVEGDGWDTPKDASKVTLKVLSATDGEKPLPGFTPATLEFAAGGGEVCDCIEFAVVEMKKGEVAHVTCTRPALCAEAKVGLKEAPKCSTVVLALELEDFEKAKDTWSLSEEEKVEYALSRKEVGGNLFKQGRIEMALERYKKVIDLFSYVDNFKDETKEKATDLKKVCQLNKAACHLKLKQNQDAKKACDEVLKVDCEAGWSACSLPCGGDEGPGRCAEQRPRLRGSCGPFLPASVLARQRWCRRAGRWRCWCGPASCMRRSSSSKRSRCGRSGRPRRRRMPTGSSASTCSTRSRARLPS